MKRQKVYSWEIISCVNNGKLKSIEEINDEIMEIVNKKL